MRILLGTYRLNFRGGTEMWTKVMFDQLVKHHKVDVFTVEGNSIWPDMPTFDEDATYDLAILNHHPTLRALRNAKLKRVVGVCHGVMPGLEWPVFGADAYVAVSEEVRDFIPVKSTVLLNPIEHERFKGSRQLNSSIQRVGVLSNHPSATRDIVAEACELIGAEFKTSGMVTAEGDTNRPEDLFEWADVVVGVGRVALEALSAGRNVYCMDQNGSDGMITRANFHELSYANWSGRIHKRWPTPKQLAEEMTNTYDPARNLRDLVIESHDPALIASKFLDVAVSIKPSQHVLGSFLRKGPAFLSSPRFMSIADPFLREARGSVRIDGRPGVLNAQFRQK